MQNLILFHFYVFGMRKFMRCTCNYEHVLECSVMMNCKERGKWSFSTTVTVHIPDLLGGRRFPMSAFGFNRWQSKRQGSGVAGVEGVLPPTQVAEWVQNKYYKWKKILIFCGQQILHYKAKYKKLEKNYRDFSEVHNFCQGRTSSLAAGTTKLSHATRPRIKSGNWELRLGKTASPLDSAAKKGSFVLWMGASERR